MPSPKLKEALAVGGIALAAVAAILYRQIVQKRSPRASWLRTISFNGKWEKFVAVDPSQLLVITDFDGTITAGDANQCHDLVGTCPLLSQAFRDEFAPLLDWTTNTSIDGVEWWDKAHELMLKHGVPPRALLQRLVREARMPPRPGVLQLLEKLAAMNVPVLIVSAGLSDVIEEWLRLHEALTENVTVCSNRLNYGADSEPQSVSPQPPVTSFTKAATYKMAGAFFRHHMARRMIMVLGDSVSDIDAAQEVPYDESLSIGFLNSRPPTAMTKYADTFDAVVLGNGGSLVPLIELVELIEANGRVVEMELANRKRHLKMSRSFADFLSTVDGPIS
ncbi:hypothetical protein AB1Y20_005369 [Prymnesium parvum]|uniref:5'-nucleotidase n=1 Tax=Prymnesium parvum TaxID=97485 RepID=A0AB34J356_PRYPA